MFNLRDLGFDRLLDRPLDEEESFSRRLDRWADRLYRNEPDYRLGRFDIEQVYYYDAKLRRRVRYAAIRPR